VRLSELTLEGKSALVTGGGNGIGRACCERFAEEGADVVVADLLDDAGNETVQLVEKTGRSGLFVHLDAASPEGNDDVARRAVEHFGRVDVLVTAAGISHAGYRSGDRSADGEMLARAIETRADPPKRLLDLAVADWQQVLDVNLTGTFLALQATARQMVTQGSGGSIVTIASVAAKHPEAGPPSYAVSKAGVWMLTKAAARSLGPAGIRVNAIGPGFIETNMTAMATAIPEVLEMFLAGLPLGRLGTAREVADAALFLASDESSYFTGEILHPDGGFFTD
jgi:NAD(P)-dependent dehydrogenase (short-subunit alcohol dehydrogenase family)